jgi:hypothetical protein
VGYEVTAHTKGTRTVDLRVAHCPDRRGLLAHRWTDGAVSSMGRAVRSAAVVLLLLSPMALSGCSAGQVTQTATQGRDRTGGASQVEDISVHAVQFVHPPGGAYEVGDQVEVTMAIVNSGRVDDQLIDVTGADFSAATLSAPPTAADTPPDTAASEPDPTDSMALSAQPPAVETTAVDVLVPARGAVFVGSSAPTVVLTGLTRHIDAAHSMELTLTFARAGQTTVPAVMGPPTDVLLRTAAVDF